MHGRLLEASWVQWKALDTWGRVSMIRRWNGNIAVDIVGIGGMSRPVEDVKRSHTVAKSAKRRPGRRTNHLVAMAW